METLVTQGLKAFHEVGLTIKIRNDDGDAFNSTVWHGSIDQGRNSTKAAHLPPQTLVVVGMTRATMGQVDHNRHFEYAVLAKICSLLENVAVVEVGAGTGEFTTRMVDAGASKVIAIETDPVYVAALQSKFAISGRVQIFPRPHIGDLHDPSQGPAILPREYFEQMVERGELPPERTILRLAAKGRGPGRVEPIASLHSTVILLEYPQNTSPHHEQQRNIDEVARSLGARGYSTFATFRHEDDVLSVTFDNSRIRPGEYGSVVFIADNVGSAVYEALRDAAADAHDTLIETLRSIRHEANRRYRVLSDLEAARTSLEERLARMTNEAHRRLEVIDELNTAVRELRTAVDAQSREAERRLEVIKTLASAAEAKLEEPKLEGIAYEQPGAESDWAAYRIWRLLHRLPLPGGLANRLKNITTPKIGRLVLHEPRPLRVPERYTPISVGDPPSIAVITPSLNHAAFIEATVHSVLAQGYPKLEYVIQDGMSTDDTLKILDRFRSDLHSFSVEPDEGQADAINRGFEKTSGEIMAYLNSDDLYLSGALAFVGRYFRQHPEVDALYGHRILIDERGDEIGRWVLPKHDDRTLWVADYVPQETLFWRRSLWERAGGRLDTTFAYAIDWELLLRFLDVGANIVRVPRFLGAFRVHDSQKTTAQRRVGEAEVERLRQRYGAPTDPQVIHRVTLPYVKRHLVIHALYRLRVLRY